jgi:hypothetical protein
LKWHVVFPVITATKHVRHSRTAASRHASSYIVPHNPPTRARTHTYTHTHTHTRTHTHTHARARTHTHTHIALKLVHSCMLRNGVGNRIVVDTHHNWNLQERRKLVLFGDWSCGVNQPTQICEAAVPAEHTTKYRKSGVSLGSIDVWARAWVQSLISRLPRSRTNSHQQA